MRIRTLLLAVLVLAVVLFAALNWVTFTTPTALSLGVTTVQAPLGLIMLCLLAAATALFLAWVIYLQGSVLLETRRQAKELQAQRDLADKAEASRFTELRQFMSAELARVTQASSEMRSNLLSRLDAPPTSSASAPRSSRPAPRWPLPSASTRIGSSVAMCRPTCRAAAPRCSSEAAQRGSRAGVRSVIE